MSGVTSGSKCCEGKSTVDPVDRYSSWPTGLVTLYFARSLPFLNCILNYVRFELELRHPTPPEKIILIKENLLTPLTHSMT